MSVDKVKMRIPVGEGGLIERAGPEVPKRPNVVLAVIINCYNYADYVGRAIASVTDQPDDRCEIVVVDDGSTDESWNVITRTGVRAYRLRNEGQRAACLYGFERTTAAFVLFLDADDELKPGAIAAIIDRLDPEVAKLQFGLTRIDAAGRPLEGDEPLETDFRARDAIARSVLRNGVYKTPPTSGNVFRRDVCALLRSADYDNAVDGVILFAAPFFGDVVNLSARLGRYRIHDRNKSGLGSDPKADTIAADIRRFEARTAHLRRTLARIAPQARLAATSAMFYHLEQRFNLAIASGRRPSFALFAGAVARLFRQPHKPRAKAAMLLYFAAGFILPNSRAKVALAYRLRARRRSAAGMLRELFRGRLPERNSA